VEGVEGRRKEKKVTGRSRAIKGGRHRRGEGREAQEGGREGSTGGGKGGGRTRIREKKKSADK
jgi:hypothetical protein